MACAIQDASLVLKGLLMILKSFAPLCLTTTTLEAIN